MPVSIKVEVKYVDQRHVDESFHGATSRFGESHEGVTFYDGRVFHSRKHPVKNVFTYPLRFAVVDLDAPPPWFISSGQAAGRGVRGD